MNPSVSIEQIQQALDMHRRRLATVEAKNAAMADVLEMLPDGTLNGVEVITPGYTRSDAPGTEEPQAFEAHPIQTAPIRKLVKALLQESQAEQAMLSAQITSLERMMPGSILLARPAPRA